MRQLGTNEKAYRWVMPAKNMYWSHLYITLDPVIADPERLVSAPFTESFG